jgi:hypothetical protein
VRAFEKANSCETRFLLYHGIKGFVKPKPDQARSSYGWSTAFTTYSCTGYTVCKQSAPPLELLRLLLLGAGVGFFLNTEA